MKQKENGGDPSSPVLKVPKFYTLLETYPRVCGLLEGLKKVEFYTSVRQGRDGFIMISDLLEEINGKNGLKRFSYRLPFSSSGRNSENIQRS